MFNNDKNKNQLVKICLQGNKHLKHVLTIPQIEQMTMIEDRFPLTKLPVCGGCERLGFWGKGMQGICKHCGTVTKNPLTYSEYLATGHDIDATGATARKVLKEEEVEARKIILPDYTNYAQDARKRFEK